MIEFILVVLVCQGTLGILIERRVDKIERALRENGKP